MSKQLASIEEQIIHEIKSGTSLIFIETHEESESLLSLIKVAEVLNKGFSGSNVLEQNKNLLENDNLDEMSTGRFKKSTNRDQQDTSSNLIDDIVNTVKDSNTIYLYNDIPTILKSGAGRASDLMVVVKAIRIFKTLVNRLKTLKSTLVLMDYSYDLPIELENDFTVLYHPVPDVDLLEKIFFDFITDSAFMKSVEKTSKVVLNNILSSAKGLTASQFRRCIASTVIKHQEIGSKTIDDILNIKKEIIQKDGMLEYIEEEVGIKDVGGLYNLKDWANKRKKAFSIKAEKEGLPSPKGILVWGVPGTGKSLISKAISGIWRRPILRFDIGRIFGSYVGESEKNMRKALRIAESIAPCILWIDEIEKAFSSADKGSEVSNRVLGTFLTWVQEKSQLEKVFIVATANDVTLLPPELLRKGRFDQLFFVDRPDMDTMKEVLSIQFIKYKLKPDNYNINKLAKVAYQKELTGSEVEQIIIDTKFDAFDKNEKPNDNDIIKAIGLIKRPIATYFYANAEKNDAYQKVDDMSLDA